MRTRGFGALLIAMVASSATVRILSGTPPQETTRDIAWRLAQDAIKQDAIKGVRTQSGIPDFVNWRTAREIYPCPGRPGEDPPANLSRDWFNESFHYNSTAAARLCAPLTSDAGAPAMDRALVFWEHSSPKASVIDPPFPAGARLGAAFWNAVRLTNDPNPGKVVELPVRSGDHTVTRRIRITIPEEVRAGSRICGPPADQVKAAADGVNAAGAKDVSLDDFFWIRLAAGERYNGAGCGDFAVLMAFHLVHKEQGRWLWTTFWWDPDSTEFGAGRPKNFQGAGDHPRAWANYAMDASFDSASVIFNPWRVEERGSNCARCHAAVAVHPGERPDETISFDSVTAAHAHFR